MQLRMIDSCCYTVRVGARQKLGWSWVRKWVSKLSYTDPAPCRAVQGIDPTDIERQVQGPIGTYALQRTEAGHLE